MKENKPEFKFKDSEDKEVFICKHILQENKPILYVVHDNDGDWQFLCGQKGHKEDNATIVPLGLVVEIDDSMNELSEMPIGIGAARKEVGEKWVPFKR